MRTRKGDLGPSRTTVGARYRFRGRLFDARTGEISDGRETVRLAPQPALVLTLLLERAGRLVPREVLQERVWPDTVVEFDKSLNFCVREVRAALGDRASDPTFVETLPRRGYRFIAPVEVLPSPEEAAEEPAEEAAAAATGRRLAWAALAVVVAGGTVILADRGGDARPPSAEAREAAEMGGYLLTQGAPDDLERSVDFFRDAVALEPRYARAYSGLGSAYLRLARAEEGKAALRRSLELNPGQWAPHLTLALRALYVEYDRATAARHFDRALERAPDEVVVRHTYAWYRVAAGDLDGAMEHMRAALAIDPVSPRVNGDVGRLFYLASRHEQAIAHCRRTRELTPDALRPRDCMVHTLAEKGATEEAREAAADLLRDRGADGEAVAAIEAGPAAEGLRAYWRWAGQTIHGLAERNEESHVHAAAAWARAGETERAFEALERAWAVRCPVLLQVEHDPAFASLANDARVRDLLRRMGGEAGGPDGRPSTGKESSRSRTGDARALQRARASSGPRSRS